MTRRDRKRRLARRERKLRDEEARKKADEADAEQRRLHPTTDFSWIHRVLLGGSFRSHEKGGYKPFEDYVLGPRVQASTPEELEERTTEFFVDEALKQTPS